MNKPLNLTLLTALALIAILTLISLSKHVLHKDEAETKQESVPKMGESQSLKEDMDDAIARVSIDTLKTKSSSNAAALPRATVVAHIVDRDDRPIANAEARLSRSPQDKATAIISYSDQEGLLIAGPLVEHGPYQMTIDVDGFLPKHFDFDVNSEQVFLGKLSLESSCRLRGRWSTNLGAESPVLR